MDKLRRQYKRDFSRPNYQPKPSQRTTTKRYGAIPGIEPGTIFSNRKACADAGVHGVTLQGIHGSNQGAYSVCLSGVYEDDEDDGESFVYTGSGGKENAFSSSSKQVEHQSFSNAYNKSLQMSYVSRRPVRVVRGPNQTSKWAPAEGYRYDGLYQVVRCYYSEGLSGRKVCKFKFRRLPNQPLLPTKPDT